MKQALRYIDNIPVYTDQTFYWGEIPKEDMEQILWRIKSQGFEAGISSLEEKFPGRSDFVFNIGRADFIWPIEFKEGMKVLDLGCGWGTHTFPLADLGLEVHAVDITVQRAQFVQARKEHEHRENVHVYVADVMDLPFKNESFDIIICNGVLEWVGLQSQYGQPDEVQQKFLQNMRGLLKPGGTMYVGIENRWAAAYLKSGVDHSGLKYTSLMPRAMADAYTKSKIGKPYLTYTYSESGYRRLFASSGFDNVETYIPFPGYNNPNSLVPHEDLRALRFFIKISGRFRNQNILLQKAIDNPVALRLFRACVYSFAFYLKK